MAEKGRPKGDELQDSKSYPPGDESPRGFFPDLSWSHYRALMRVENEHARSFYELEAAGNRWNKRQLELQRERRLIEERAHREEGDA